MKVLAFRTHIHTHILQFVLILLAVTKDMLVYTVCTQYVYINLFSIEI